jgi:hypothetical protein
MFPTFATSRLREILAVQSWNYVGEKWLGKFILKMPDFHVALRDILYAVTLRHGTHSFTSLSKEGVLRNFFFALKNPDGFGRV